ncbi:hypothetical protein ACFVP8_20310 [Viridibacillus arvi]|uniref:AAA family ATPase n=1 Tax=Viridibacillus arvi TaxID=263475 RepID=UPI0036BDF453
MPAFTLATEEIDNVFEIKETTIKHFTEQISAYSDKKGSHYYNLLSSLQKSIRGSDVNASMYYLANLLESGDLISTCRRLVVIAFEDIGNANANCGTNVKAAVDTALMVGMPEARIPLAKAVVEMCLSEKSNSAYIAIDKAVALVRSGHTPNIPDHLKDTHYAGAKTLGHVGYKYPHDYPVGTFGGLIEQTYLPDDLVGTEFYTPIIAGDEKRMAALYENVRKYHVPK